ncbi:hypothetical protein NDU88_004061 [Pleurodeles waltl]|uniref:Uncharacterized protein n=1 Tax=Pleurodeles waltl TaxID=8319 RepID=A0AAV7M787_PLEWA|nr:hypothetical protein NDU88_004061 [Pleurodeles waltl]
MLAGTQRLPPPYLGRPRPTTTGCFAHCGVRGPKSHQFPHSELAPESLLRQTQWPPQRKCKPEYALGAPIATRQWRASRSVFPKVLLRAVYGLSYLPSGAWNLQPFNSLSCSGPAAEPWGSTPLPCASPSGSQSPSAKRGESAGSAPTAPQCRPHLRVGGGRGPEQERRHSLSPAPSRACRRMRVGLQPRGAPSQTLVSIQAPQGSLSARRRNKVGHALHRLVRLLLGQLFVSLFYVAPSSVLRVAPASPITERSTSIFLEGTIV